MLTHLSEKDEILAALPLGFLENTIWECVCMWNVLKKKKVTHDYHTAHTLTPRLTQGWPKIDVPCK